jgi:hypothetical protein
MSKEFPHSVVGTMKCRTFVPWQNIRVESIPRSYLKQVPGLQLQQGPGGNSHIYFIVTGIIRRYDDILNSSPRNKCVLSDTESATEASEADARQPCCIFEKYELIASTCPGRSFPTKHSESTCQTKGLWMRRKKYVPEAYSRVLCACLKLGA